ncbi:MAG: hypothetical protein Terrestrivirus2_148 [Terrestrivirus sp.]|uniref:Uncharacterized protein n=1 Tax=Terrestrivirus sp. TaxID=2487775 RepID=A0A3G4ZLB4_9VIRU|nr:MAG: hypothetical protein Terrestrivirus2_148 [Terrestrivirus sp.]
MDELISQIATLYIEKQSENANISTNMNINNINSLTEIFNGLNIHDRKIVETIKKDPENLVKSMIKLNINPTVINEIIEVIKIIVNKPHCSLYFKLPTPSYIS